MTIKSNESPLMRFIKSSGIFFIGSVLSKAMSILMLPLYTNRIPTDSMGYYDLSLTYTLLEQHLKYIRKHAESLNND